MDIQSNIPVTRLLAVGTAAPKTVWQQETVAELLGVTNPITKKLFKSPHIKQRHLYLPEADSNTGQLPQETKSELIAKMHKGALEIGTEAIHHCLDNLGAGIEDIDYLVCTTSTGFLVPGLSALYIRHLGMKQSCQRLDIVGMGCNAGLNALNAVTNWTKSNPNKLAVMVCCEINSASYCVDDTVRTGVVNSLFGDGAAALAVSASVSDVPSRWSERLKAGPRVYGFESYIIPEQHASMRFDWDEEQSRWSFFISKEIPFILGENITTPVNILMDRFGIKSIDNVTHWILHTGGGLVIDGIKNALGLSEQNVQHTRNVLFNYGNLSSGSFLFSYELVERHDCPKENDLGIMITMGPGAQIETCLLKW